MLPQARGGMRMGNGQVLDAMMHDGLWCAIENCSMGDAAEAVVERYGVTREDQDAFAAGSHQKAANAIRECFFKDEILPVEIPQRRGDPIRLEYDEGVRPDTTAEALARLRPAFKKEGGTVTAGNAPGGQRRRGGHRRHGRGARGRARGSRRWPVSSDRRFSGRPAKWLLMTPVEAVRKLLVKVGWTLDDVDLIELNEAFSAQAVAVVRELGADPAKVNVNGGAVALGHPIGASGARILTTLLYALRNRNLKRGIATLCLGGGNGVALAVERA